MFCKLVDSYATNFEPFCPAVVCEKYGLDPSRCLNKAPDGNVVGIGIQSLAPVLSTTWDVDTEYVVLVDLLPEVSMECQLASPSNLTTNG
jgi:hypothetical protein